MKIKALYIIVLFCSINTIIAQTAGLVSFDIPARNSLKFNKFVINPTFSFVREDQSFITLYNKTQWTDVENPPQTYFLSYSGKFREDNGIAIGVFRQNYGVFSTFGAITNFARNVSLSSDSNLTFGLNLGYLNSGINTGLVVTNDVDPTLQALGSSSSVNISPGINYGTATIDIGVTANSVVNYNFGTSEIVSGDPKQSVAAHFMYTGYIYQGGFFENSKFSTLVRGDLQKGKTVVSGLFLFDVPKAGWFQAGYNNLNGVSAGLGLKVAKKIFVGYNVEKSLGQFADFGLSHEIVLAYKLRGYDVYEDSKPIVKAKKNTKSKTEIANTKSEVQLKKDELAAQARARIAARAAEAKAKAEAARLLRENLANEAKLKNDPAAKALAEAERLRKLKEAADAKLAADAEAERIRKEKEVQNAKSLAENAAKLKADAEGERLRKAKEVADAKLINEARLREQAAAEAKARAEEERLRKLREAADAKTKAEIDAKLKADAAAEAARKAKEAADAKANADARAKADAEAERIRKAKEAADAKAIADAKASADAKAKADAEAERLRKLNEDTDAKLAAENRLKAQAEAEAKAKAEEERLRKLREDADAKTKAEIDAKLKADAAAEAARKASEAAAEKAIADAKAKADAEAERLRKTKEAADAKAIADAKAVADAKAKADADAERARKSKEAADAKALADAKAKEAADAERARIAKEAADAKAIADAKAKEAAEAERVRRAKALADAKAIADAKAKADAEEERVRNAKEAADAKIAADLAAKNKAAADAKAVADAEAERLRRIEEENAKKEVSKSVEDKRLDDMIQVNEDANNNQAKALSKLEAIRAEKNKELNDLINENNLSDKGIVSEPKAFKSVSAANRELESLKLEMLENARTQGNLISQAEAAYNERLKKIPNKNDAINIDFQKRIDKLKADKRDTDKQNADLLTELERIKALTEIERKRRIKRATFEDTKDIYNKDRAALRAIKETTTKTNQVFKPEDFDYGDNNQANTQIFKKLENVPDGFYLVVASHREEAKRDEFVKKAIQAGQSNIDFFYNQSQSKYYIFYQKFDSIEEANQAMQGKGNKPFNGKMVVIKVEK